MLSEGSLKILVSPEPIYKVHDSDQKTYLDLDLEKYLKNPYLAEIEELRAELDVMIEDRERIRKYNEVLINGNRQNGELIRKVQFDLVKKVCVKNEQDKLKLQNELDEANRKLREKEKILESMRSLLAGVMRQDTDNYTGLHNLHKKSQSLSSNQISIDQTNGSLGIKPSNSNLNKKFASSGIRSGLKLQSARNSPIPSRSSHRHMSIEKCKNKN